MAQTIPTTANKKYKGFAATDRLELLNSVLDGSGSMVHCLERFLDYLEQTS